MGYIANDLVFGCIWGLSENGGYRKWQNLNRENDDKPKEFGVINVPYVQRKDRPTLTLKLPIVIGTYPRTKRYSAFFGG